MSPGEVIVFVLATDRNWPDFGLVVELGLTLQTRIIIFKTILKLAPALLPLPRL